MDDDNIRLLNLGFLTIIFYISGFLAHSYYPWFYDDYAQRDLSSFPEIQIGIILLLYSIAIIFSIMFIILFYIKIKKPKEFN